jgi:hypothetical protein
MPLTGKLMGVVSVAALVVHPIVHGLVVAMALYWKLFMLSCTVNKSSRVVL